MPTLKKLINQMEHNDPYIIQINEFVQQDKQTKHLLRGLKIISTSTIQSKIIN